MQIKKKLATGMAVIAVMASMSLNTFAHDIPSEHHVDTSSTRLEVNSIAPRWSETIMTICLVALLLATSVFSAMAAENTEDNWDNLYYETVATPRARGANSIVEDEDNILQGRTANPTKVVQIYALTYNTIDEIAITEFANAVNNGENMADMLEATDTYLTQNISDTLIMTREGSSFQAQAVMEKDEGDSFTIESTVKSQLSSAGMKPTANTSVKCVGVPAVGTAILFSEGDTEYIVFNVSRFEDLVETDTVYTVKELSTIMEQNKSVFALDPLGPTEE